MRVVTTSWDDGDRADLKVAELLGERGLPGTFYVPLTSQVTSTRLAVSELTFLADNGFEIGAHTFSHRTLTQLRLEEIRREVTTCKSALEQIIGKPVSVFCYPNGRYTQDTITELKRAGYDGARTTRMLSCAQNFPPFKMPVSLQAYPHARSTYLRNLLRAMAAGVPAGSNWQNDSLIRSCITAEYGTCMVTHGRSRLCSFGLDSGKCSITSPNETRLPTSATEICSRCGTAKNRSLAPTKSTEKMEFSARFVPLLVSFPKAIRQLASRKIIIL